MCLLLLLWNFLNWIGEIISFVWLKVGSFTSPISTWQDVWTFKHQANCSKLLAYTSQYTAFLIIFPCHVRTALDGGDRRKEGDGPRYWALLNIQIFIYAFWYVDTLCYKALHSKMSLVIKTYYTREFLLISSLNQRTESSNSRWQC